jgi:O-antigen ligase
MAGALAAGVLALAGLVLAHEGNPKYVVVAFSCMAMLVVLPLIGNLRLFSFYCVLMLAPLGLRLTFAAHAHMGGAGGVYVEAVDPFMLLLLFFQVRDRMKGNVHTFRFPVALWLFVGLMGLGVGSALIGDFKTLAILELIRMLKVLLLALVVVNEVVRRRQFEHAIGALTVGLILQACIALTQNLSGAQLGLQVLGEASDEDIEQLGITTLESGEFVYRAGALLGHANLLAAYLALFLPMSIALFLSQAPRVLRAMSVVALLTGPPALVLTLSRGGWLDFVAAFVVVITLGAAHPGSRRLFVFARTATVMGVLVVGIAMSPSIIKRLTEADPSSVKYRLEWIRTAQAMIEDNPVLGVGLNTYVFTQLPYGPLKTPAEMNGFYGDIWPVVHNNWLIVWSEQGTVGFLIWVAFHIAVIGVGVKNLRIRDPVVHALSVGLLAGFIAIMVDGLASFYLRQEATARTFWVATGLILAAGYWRRNYDEAASPVPAAPAAALQQPAPASSEGRWLPHRTSLLR